MAKKSSQDSLQIKITVKDEDKYPVADLYELEETQGELKTLTKENFDKLRRSILDEGYFIPMFVWAHKGKLKILDGHQRKRVLTHMKDTEGYAVPRLPYVAIHADSLAHAKRRLLLITSQFGKIEGQGLYEFIQGMDETTLVTDFNLPNVNAPKFLDEFFVDSANMIAPAAPELPATMASVGGNGVKMLQLFYTEEEHQIILKLIKSLQDKYGTENATDTVRKALEYANNHG